MAWKEIFLCGRPFGSRSRVARIRDGTGKMPISAFLAEIERMRVQKLARAEFERTIEMSKQANAQLA